MFYNRPARLFPVDLRKSYIRPSLTLNPGFGTYSYGCRPELNREMLEYNRDLRSEMKRELHRELNRELHREFNREFHNELNHEFNRGEYGWNWSSMPANAMVAPADVLELDEQFIIEVALPGVVLDDIQLKIEDNVLSLTAKRTPTLFEERAHVLQKELPSVYLLRQFEFEIPVIIEQIEARLDRGILYISIPKVEAALRIPVSGGMIESHSPNTPKTRVSSKHEVTVK